MLHHLMFVGIYGNTALYDFGVISIHPTNSGPDILLLLLKAPIKN